MKSLLQLTCTRPLIQRCWRHRSVPFEADIFALSNLASSTSGRASSSSSFSQPPSRSWQPPPTYQASDGFIPPQLRTSRNRKELRRREVLSSEIAARKAWVRGTPIRPEVSPRRKRLRGKRHKHGTDLEDLGVASVSKNVDRHCTPSSASSETAPALGPRFYDRQIVRLVRRPVATLPRTPQYFVRFGPPMTAEDLTHDAPSVLVESRRLIKDVLERRQAAQSAPDYVAPDTPFWRLPPRVLKKKPATWQEEPSYTAKTAKSAKASDVSDVDGGLQGILDIRSKTSTSWRFQAVSPERAAQNLHSGSTSDQAIAENAVGQGEVELPLNNESVPGQRSSANSSRVRDGKRGAGPGEGLIAALRQQAQDHARTGVNPDITSSLHEALKQHPGTERAARLREMQNCDIDFETLVMEGKASVSNCNALIRAQALQGNMEEAIKTHDAMKLHGFEPDAETFVSLLAGAAHLKDAELARRLFLKMREQLISPTQKVYSILMQAHVRASDTASGYSLLRKMEDERLHPDVVVHTVLINGLVSEGRLEKAWEEFHSIRTWKLIQPDEVMFTVMIKACAMNQEAERALNLLDDLRMCGLYPTDITYGELINAMSSSPDHSRKAFDFYRQMQAEDLPITNFVFEKLLQACKNLGDAKLAKSTIQEMSQMGFSLEPDMYCHLVGLFATAMQRQKVTETEKLRNLRSAWHVVAEARHLYKDRLDWTAMLNEVLSVYIAGGFTHFAMEMLKQYPLFGTQPDADTWQNLLQMLGHDLKDVGRFFSLWEAMPKDPQPPDELYHLALDMAMQSRSSRRTVAVLEEMYAVNVFPSPQLTEQLAKVGRNVIQIHHLVGKFIQLNRDIKVSTAKRETALLQTHMDERETLLAADGYTVRDPTPEQQERDQYFDKLHARGAFKRPWLPVGEYLASKKRGGEVYAKRHDKPRPNLLAA